MQHQRTNSPRVNAPAHFSGFAFTPLMNTRSNFQSGYFCSDVIPMMLQANAQSSLNDSSSAGIRNDRGALLGDVGFGGWSRTWLMHLAERPSVAVLERLDHVVLDSPARNAQ